ncbi:MAG: TIGR02996 domain-containing protein [Planctomycetia bacterium]|nr:TIGR02996 domain-containing protein [Planctomycetia bacterium]
MEDDFIAAILDAPDDATPRLVYADWLEDRGDPRAELLRIEAEFLAMPLDDERVPALRARLRELHRTLDPVWLGLLKRVPFDPLDELRTVVPPPKRPYANTGNWDGIEKQLGLVLPADYKAYISAYGGGDIGCIEIPSPFGTHEDVRVWWERWASFYRDIAEYEDVPYRAFPEAGGLLPFGTLGTVDNLSWLTVGEPNGWPFVYRHRDDGFFQIKGLSAVEFILEAVTQRSPLLTQLRRLSAFDPPVDFQPYKVVPRTINFIAHRRIDLNSLTERLSCHWPPDQVQFRPTVDGTAILAEPLAGRISIYSEGERTFATVNFDGAYATGVEQVVANLLNAGFGEI